MDITIRPMTINDAPAVTAIADVAIGPGYYPETLVIDYIERSRVKNISQSFVACDEEKVIGFRFTFPPNRWEAGRGKGLSADKWPASLSETAYFQSCFIDENYMGNGIGKRLSNASIDSLRKTGTRLVIAHSWKESPHNSSFRYLSKLGFHPVAEYIHYWYDVDYVCKICGKPCVCTAIEMALDLQEK
jgi:predicted N-acetyltransferase YhbS